MIYCIFVILLGYFIVEWDNGNRGKYRYGAESGVKDVRMVDESRMLSFGMMVVVGVRARRGVLFGLDFGVLGILLF